MEYESQMKSVGNIGVDVTFTPPSLEVPFQQGISQIPKISYKQGLAFKPKFVKYTIDTSVASIFEFWAPADFNINPN